MRCLLIFFLVPMVLSQTHTGAAGNVDPATMAEGVDNIRKLTGIAAQIMELSNNIMGGAGSGGDSVRPSFHGVRNFETDNSITSGSSQDNSIRNMARLISEYGSGFLVQQTTPTTTTTTTTRPNMFQSLMSTFLGDSYTFPLQSAGSSVDSAPEALPPPPTPRPRQSNLFGGLFGGGNSAPVPREDNGSFMGLIDTFMPTTAAPTRAPGLLSMFGLPTAPEKPSSSKLGKIDIFEMLGMAPRTTTTTEAPLRALLSPGSYVNGGDAQNIDKILNALVRSNAQPAPRAEPGAAGLISSFFGRK